MTFALGADARLMQGQDAPARELTGDVGRRVKIRYTMDGVTKVADRVEVQGNAP